MATQYNGLEFKTQLEAQWAAFFDLAGWHWWANPAAVGNWKPDFKVKFDCNHSECGGYHTLLVTVLPMNSIEQFKNHPCLSNNCGVENEKGESVADGGAAFGISPSVTEWEISHGSGAGSENIDFRVSNASELWEKAKSLVNK